MNHRSPGPPLPRYATMPRNEPRFSCDLGHGNPRPPIRGQIETPPMPAPTSAQPVAGRARVGGAGENPGTPRSPDPGGASGGPTPVLLLAGVQASRAHVAPAPRLAPADARGIENGWSYGDSNPRPLPCHGSALPTAP